MLADVLVEASTSDDLDRVLDRIAGQALEGTGGDRTSIFLLDDEGRHLVLRAARHRGDPAPELWALGRSLPPIPLDDVPLRRELFARGKAVAVADARTSPLVPPEWSSAFELASLVVAPLRAGARTLGVLVVDYREPQVLSAQLVGLTAAIGRAAAVAVSSAVLTSTLRDRAASLQALLDATRMLQSPRSMQETCEEVADAIAVVLAAPHLSVHLLTDEGRFRTIVQRGVGLPDAAELRALPLLARATVTRAWRDGDRRPVVLRGLQERPMAGVDVPEGVGSALVLPLAQPGGDLVGFILVGVESERGPDGATLDLAGALAAHVAFAVDRAQLTEQVAMGAEFATTLLSLNDLDGEAGGLLAGLRRAVPSAIGFEVVDVWVRPASGRRPAAPATPPERDLWRRWRARRTRPPIETSSGVAYAPLWTGERVVGLLRARPLAPTLAPHERDLLEALAAALGEWAARSQREEERRLQELQLALAEDRAMAAADMRDRLGRLVAMIVDHAETVAAGLHGESRRAVLRLAGVARRALRETEVAAGSVDATAGRPSLEPSITDLVAALGRELDMAVSVTVRGDPRPLPVDAEQALIGVMQEVMRGVGALSRASAIVVRIEFGPEAVAVVVRDDGVGLAGRSDAFGAVPIVPLRSAQERLEAVGGRLTISHESPRGLMLRAEVPA